MGIASALVVLIQVVLAEAGATTRKKNDEVMENLIEKDAQLGFSPAHIRPLTLGLVCLKLHAADVRGYELRVILKRVQPINKSISNL
ncbi:hypothetical protein GBA52_023520 [Prunus armeniaca]|nr:hypothetical protein GBA52_023520 [Prunus armeniaca]